MLGRLPGSPRTPLRRFSAYKAFVREPRRSSVLGDLGATCRDLMQAGDPSPTRHAVGGARERTRRRTRRCRSPDRQRQEIPRRSGKKSRAGTRTRTPMDEHGPCGRLEKRRRRRRPRRVRVSRLKIKKKTRQQGQAQEALGVERRGGGGLSRPKPGARRASSEKQRMIQEMF